MHCSGVDCSSGETGASSVPPASSYTRRHTHRIAHTHYTVSNHGVQQTHTRATTHVGVSVHVFQELLEEVYREAHVINPELPQGDQRVYKGWNRQQSEHKTILCVPYPILKSRQTKGLPPIKLIRDSSCCVSMCQPTKMSTVFCESRSVVRSRGRV